MTIDVLYRCGGCDAQAEVRGVSRQKIRQISPGIHATSTSTFLTLAPRGWIAFDRYTGCTYCPKCWAEIEGGESQ